jgi:hypothetical protein
MINKNDKQKQEAIKWLSNEIENIPNYISNNSKSTNKSNDLDLNIKSDPMTKSNIVAPPLCEIALFKYNAISGNDTGYWDKFPLSIIVRPLPTHFFGFNLHYLNYDTRKKIIDILVKFKRNNISPELQFKTVYPFLDGLVKIGKFNFAYKNYNYENMESKFIIIQPKYYNLVIELPIARFKENNK